MRYSFHLRMAVASYHNHSSWSDGKATIPDLIAAARSVGIHELGISDHWVLHPERERKKWAMPVERLGAYVGEMLALRDDPSRLASPVLRLGLEVDWFPGHSVPLRQALSKHPFDYLICSVHEVRVPDVGAFMIDMSPAAWEKLTQDQRNAIHRQYWINMKSLAESGVFDIVAHLDLPKKFAFYPTIDLSEEIAAALDAIAQANLVVELNTSGWHKPCVDAYPSIEILKECFRRKIRTTLSADAHQPEHLLRDFDRGAERLAEAGYTYVARLERRKVRLEPLAEAVKVQINK